MTLTLERRLLKREQQGNLRRLQRVCGLVDFASNDYLGLARSPSFGAAVFEAWERDKRVGATGSRLLTGNSQEFEELEARIAAFHGYEAGLLFNCGYMANVGLLSTVATQAGAVFFDAGVHASVRDGIRLGRAKAFAFRHNDLNHLEDRLKKGDCLGNRFICVESVYSTDGSLAPILGLCELAKRYGAHLIVDEAHAVGVYGPKGRGRVAEYAEMGAVFAQVVTFGKALGSFGAIVLGSCGLREALINFATSYMYTTALPRPALAAIGCSYDVFPFMESERKHLRQLMGNFAQKSLIQAIAVRGNVEGKRISQGLKQAGFDVRPLLSPTVQRGSEVLRLVLHAFNTEEELTRLIDLLGAVW